MKVKQITWQHRNDFKAIMECEHCGHEQNNNSGYSDSFYYQRVIPAIHCDSCGKNRYGSYVHTDKDVTPC